MHIPDSQEFLLDYARFAPSNSFDLMAAEDLSVDKWPDVPKLNPKTLVPALNPIMVVDGAGLDKLAAYLGRVNEYVLDYETNCVDTFFHRRARTLQIGDRNEQYIIDFLAFAETPERLIRAQGLYRAENAVSPADLAILEPVIKIIRPSLESNSHLKVGQFLEFEYIVSKWCLGMRIWNFWCTLRAERDLTNGAVPVHQKDFWGLDDLVRRYCKFQISKDEQTSFDLVSPLTDEQIIYMALDIRLPAVIKNAQVVKVTKEKLTRSVQITMDAIPAFGDMHLNGMFADPDQWKKIIEDNERDLLASIADMDTFFVPVVGEKVKWDQAEIDRLEAVYKSYSEKSPEEVTISLELRTCRKDLLRTAELKELRSAHEGARKAAKEVAKQEYATERAKGNAKAKDDYSKMKGRAAINYNAPQQLLAALWAGPFGLNKTNLKSSGDEELERHGHIPVIKAMRNYRSLSKALSTYGHRWVLTRLEIDPITGKHGFVDPDTGRIHSRFNQCGTDTGRPSSTNPNVLNLPSEDRYRSPFISRPGYDMVDKDCSGQELRILVEYTQEPAWVDAFRRDKDPHSISAEMISKELWRRAANMTETTIMVDGKPVVIPPCAYYHNDREKCECPGHIKMRKRYKALTLGKVMGKTIFSFAKELGLSKEDTQVMITAWETELRVTQTTLEALRDKCYNDGEARTLAGRRRIIRKVTYEQAKVAAQEKYGDKCDQNKITQTMQSKIAAVKREGANVYFQGTGADLMMLAMGCGSDPDGKEYLWHRLHKYNADLLLYLYDEFLVESPEEHSKEVELEIEDAIRRSGAEFVKSVPFKSDGMVSKRWQK